MRTLILILLSLLTPTLALAGVRIEHWTAPSGAKVYFVETRVLPILDVQIDFAAGTAFVAAGKSGLAGLTQGLLEAGAAGLDEEHIAGRLADIAAHLGGGVDNDRASVSVRTLSSKSEKESALDLMRTVLSAPTFPQSVLERERGAHHRQHPRSGDAPGCRCRQAFCRSHLSRPSLRCQSDGG